jgi:hypothetical protein
VSIIGFLPLDTPMRDVSSGGLPMINDGVAGTREDIGVARR